MHLGVTFAKLGGKGCQECFKGTEIAKGKQCTHHFDLKLLQLKKKSLDLFMVCGSCEFFTFGSNIGVDIHVLSVGLLCCLLEKKCTDIVFVAGTHSDN